MGLSRVCKKVTSNCIVQKIKEEKKKTYDILKWGWRTTTSLKEAQQIFTWLRPLLEALWSKVGKKLQSQEIENNFFFKLLNLPLKVTWSYNRYIIALFLAIYSIYYSYVDIDQGIHKEKMKVALNEKQKKLHGFSFSINMANSEAFWGSKSWAQTYLLWSVF